MRDGDTPTDSQRVHYSVSEAFEKFYTLPKREDQGL